MKFSAVIQKKKITVPHSAFKGSASEGRLVAHSRRITLPSRKNAEKRNGASTLFSHFAPASSRPRTGRRNHRSFPIKSGDRLEVNTVADKFHLKRLEAYPRGRVRERIPKQERVQNRRHLAKQPIKGASIVYQKEVSEVR